MCSFPEVLNVIKGCTASIYRYVVLCCLAALDMQEVAWETEK